MFLFGKIISNKASNAIASIENTLNCKIGDHDFDETNAMIVIEPIKTKKVHFAADSNNFLDVVKHKMFSTFDAAKSTVSDAFDAITKPPKPVTHHKRLRCLHCHETKYFIATTIDDAKPNWVENKNPSIRLFI